MAHVTLGQLLISAVIILLVLMVVLLKSISNIQTSQKQVHFEEILNQSLKRDCDVELVYSMSDAQCEAVCKPPGVFYSKNGACVNILAFSQTAVTNECNPKNGVLAYLLGDPQFGKTKLLCLSIDPGIQPDDPNGHNKICEGGTINIDYRNSFPLVSSCKCADGTFLALLPGTSVVRASGACVNNALRKVLDFNGLTHQAEQV